jgi:hypothetical protein
MRMSRLPVIVMLFAFLLILGGCFDRTKRIAIHTLLDDNGTLDKASYTAALEKRFPAGSSIAGLQRYVVAVKGTCTKTESEKYRCEIPVRGTVCYAYFIGIDVNTDDDSIRELKVQFGDLSC